MFDKNKIVWAIFATITIFLLVYFLKFPPIRYGGDLVEYYGITESILNHGSIDLTIEDQKNLEQAGINPLNFSDSQYYIKGRKDKRYPVHFVFYSILNVPVRLALKIFDLPQINTLRITNLILFTIIIFFILKKFIISPFKKEIFLVVTYLSPLVSFIIWPGPDLFYTSMLLLSIYFFFNYFTSEESPPVSGSTVGGDKDNSFISEEDIKSNSRQFLNHPRVVQLHSPNRPRSPFGKLFGFAQDKLRVTIGGGSHLRCSSDSLFYATLFASIASWHSQPLIVIALFFFLCFVFLTTTAYSEKSTLEGKMALKTSSLQGSRYRHPRSVFKACLLLIIIGLPYLYNYYFFGVVTPWILFEETRTLYYGFGLQNASLIKLFEQFFDLNIGLFWYIPVIFVAGLYYILKFIKKDWRGLILIVLVIITALLYHTNPAWNYGTSGYGPTRHVLFVIPVLIFVLVRNIKTSKKAKILIGAIIISQMFTLSINNFLAPNFLDSLAHSPYAKYILDNYPEVYNPTAEIFIDRTNQTDLKYPTSAVYKKGQICKKAYILFMDKDYIERQCGFIPKQYQKFFISRYMKKQFHDRVVRTTEATLWADQKTCEEDDSNIIDKPYVCLHNLDQITKYTGVEDSKRWQKVEGYKGAWKLIWGDPVDLVIPRGYITDYYSFDGMYIDY